MKPAVEWIAFTLLAAFMQSVRTAGQKSLTKSISPFATTWVRYGFGLPIALIYVAIVWHSFGRPEINWHWTFFTFATLAGIMQIGATWLLVRVLQLRNFAVGTTYAKTEAILTALLAVLFFSATISLIGWISVIIGVAGILIVSVQKSHLSLKQFFTDRSLVYGVGAGLGFALTSLWLREASLSLQAPFLLSAAVTLAVMVSLQTLIAGVILHCSEPASWASIAQNYRLSIFVGITSALGSLGWFTAMTYEQAAYVKALGQIEFVFTIAITCWVFKEQISRVEYVGIGLVILAVITLLVGL